MPGRTGKGNFLLSCILYPFYENKKKKKFFNPKILKEFYDRHFPGECNPNGWKLCLGDNGVPKCIEKHKWCDKERSCGIFMKWCDKKFSLSKVIDGMCLPMNYQYQYYQSGDYEFECPKYGLNEEYMTTASGMDFLIHGQIRYFLL